MFPQLKESSKETAKKQNPPLLSKPPKNLSTLNQLPPINPQQNQPLIGRELGVIIPSYSQWPYVLTTILSLWQSEPEAVAILVDDGSPDWDQFPWHQLPENHRHQLVWHRFKKNERNLTRSWNHGLQLARQLKLQVTAVANSDLKFSKGWFTPMRQHLRRVTQPILLGPLTNAPGHRKKQQIRQYQKTYQTSDETVEINDTQAYLDNRYAGQLSGSGLNGYCVVARTDDWWLGAFSSDYVFNPGKKMTGNEDEYQRRWVAKGRRLAVVLDSFVFHYRGVTRSVQRPGNHPAGRFRITN